MFFLFFFGQLQQAIQLADQQQKQALIAFSAEWCGPCKVFHKDAQEDPTLIEELSKFVFLELAIETEEGMQAKEKYQIRSFPAFLLLDGDGEIVYRWKGYEKPALLELLKELGTDQRSLETRLLDFIKFPTLQDSLRLSDYYVSGGQNGDALPFLQKAIELGGHNNLEFEWFSTYLGIFAQGKCDLAELTHQARRAMANLKDNHLKILVCDRLCWAAKKSNDATQIKSILDMGLKLAKSDPERYGEFIEDFERVLKEL